MSIDYYSQLHSASNVSIVNTAWWQVVLALIVAFATALFTHYFYERRRKSSAILVAGAQLISATRQLRRNYLGFAEYETEFNRQQSIYFKATVIKNPNLSTPMMIGSLDNKHQADLSRSAAEAATAQAKIYQKEILLTQNEIDESYFQLLGLSNNVRKDDELKLAVEALLGFQLFTIFSETIKGPLESINKVFDPNLKIIQNRCGMLMEANSGRI